MRAVEERISDRAVLKLLRAILRAGVMQDGNLRRPVTGAAQGGVISPLLCNAYLHRIDRVWSAREHGGAGRGAGGAGALRRRRAGAVSIAGTGPGRPAAAAEPGGRTRAAAEGGQDAARAPAGGRGRVRLPRLSSPAGALPSPGWAPTGRVPGPLARWPADKAMQHARNRIRELTDRRRLLRDAETGVRDVNAFLRGWVGYFRYGHSAQRFSKIRSYVRMRVALFLSKRHRRSRSFGWWALLTFTPNEFGLIGLYGIVVSPRAGKPSRDKPNTAGERRR